jgi:hypothetical protein
LRPEEPKEVIEAKEGLAQACDTIAEDSDADDFLRLKASDVRAYLASGVA